MFFIVNGPMNKNAYFKICYIILIILYILLPK